MLKSIIFAALVFFGANVTAQVQTQIIGDSVRIKSNTGTAELILENSTKNVNGYLYNKGNGRTEFRTVSDYTVQTLTDGSTITWNAANGSNSAVTLGGTNRTLAITNPVAGQTYHMKVIQDGTGGRSITTWPSNTLWPGGIKPSLSATASAIDLVTLYYDGTNYYGDCKLLYKPVPTGVYVYAYDAKDNVNATTHSFTNVPPGALLVVTTTAGSSQFNDSIYSSPVLTWTKRVDASGSNSGDAEIYTAVYTAGGDLKVTSNWGSQAQASVCYVILNQETTLAGATATGINQSAPSVNLTTTRANSLIIAVTSDWNAISGPVTFRNSPKETHYSLYVTGGTFYHYYKQATTTASYTMGLSAPTGQSGGTALLEVRGN